MNQFKDKKVLAAYLLVCVVWGSTYLAIRIGVTQLPPMLFAGTRHIAAGILMLAYVKFKGYEMPVSWRDYLKIGVVGIFLLTMGNGCVVVAEQWVESGFVSLVVAINPIIIVVFEVLILRKTGAGIMQLASILLGFLGVLVLVGAGSNMDNVPAAGLVLSIIAPVAWAAGSLVAAGRPVSGHIFSVSGIQMLFGGAGQLAVGIALKEHMQTINITSSSLMAWIYLILFGSIGGYSAYQYTLKKLPTSLAATSTYINPVVAVALGAVFLNETLTVKTLISTAMIIASVVMLNYSKSRGESKKAVA